jgi:hypothetical protein
MTKNEDLKPITVYDELFSLVESQTGKVLFNSEMDDIIRVVEKYNRPTVTPTDEKGRPMTYWGGLKNMKDATTDGDAEKALEWFELILDENDVERGWAHNFISAALQSTRKPPVDTIPVSREVLKRVRDAIDGLLYGVDLKNGTHAKIYRPKLEQALASLDAVLSEGE